jgi:hypothetical protein
MNRRYRPSGRGRSSGLIGLVGTGIVLVGCGPNDSGAGKPAADLPSRPAQTPVPKDALHPALPSANKPGESDAAIIGKKLRVELEAASKQPPEKAPPRSGGGKKTGGPRADTTSRRERQRQLADERTKSG